MKLLFYTFLGLVLVAVFVVISVSGQSKDSPDCTAEEYQTLAGVLALYADVLGYGDNVDWAFADLEKMVRVFRETCTMPDLDLDDGEMSLLDLLYLQRYTRCSDDCTVSLLPQEDQRPVELVTFEVIITATPDPNATEAVRIITATPMPDTGAPAITLAPTVANAQLEILDVIGPGEITTEGVVMRNTGLTLVNLGGWMLSDDDGNSYVFPEDRRLFGNAGFTLNTRAGRDTPILLFWGRETAVYDPGDIIMLTDPDGNVHDAFRVPDNP